MGKLGNIEKWKEQDWDHWKTYSWVTNYFVVNGEISEKKSHLMTDSRGEFVPPGYALQWWQY